MVDFGISRVSSEEQKQTGISSDIQVDELLNSHQKYPDKNILKENIEKAEAVSGGFKKDQVKRYWNGTKFIIEFECKERTDLINILKRIQPSDRIFFAKWDRLSRDFSFLQQFAEWCKERKIELNPLNDDKEEIVRQIFSVLGQWERQKTIDRVSTTQKGTYNKGGFPFKPPFGYYKNLKLESGKLKYPNKPESCLIINEKEADIIRECYKTAIQIINTNNKSLYREACKRLKITPDKYYNIIRNRIYCGMTHTNDKDWKASELIPPIITEEEYNKVNSK